MVVHSLNGAGHVVDLELAAAGCGPELGGGSLADVAVLVLLAPLEGLALRVGCAEGLAGGNVGQAAGALEEKVVAPDAALDAAGDTDGGRLGATTSMVWVEVTSTVLVTGGRVSWPQQSARISSQCCEEEL